MLCDDEDDDDEYINLSFTSTSCSFYSHIHHFPSPAPSFTMLTFRTFNAGIGMVLIVSANNVDQVIAELASSDDPIGSRVFKLGHLKARDSPGCPQVVTNGSYSMV